jgi:hypothetical protein
MKYLVSTLLIAFLISCGGGDKKKGPEKMDETHSQESTVETPKAEEMTESEESAAMPETETETKLDVVKNDAPKENKTEKQTVKTKNEWTGYVVNVGMASTSNVKKLSKAEAAEQMKNNQIIGFFSDGKVYLVYNTDGTYASRDLAKNADSDSFTIMGDMSNINGMNVIIAKSFK